MDSYLYVGTGKGVVALRSSDGRSWQVENRGLENWGASDVAAVPSAPNQVLAATRGDGVWLSEDFGKSWTKPSYGKRGPGKTRCVTIDPKNARRVYAGCEPIDVFLSDDLCHTWQRLDSMWDVPWVSTVTYPVATVEPHVRDVAVDPNDPDTIYAALQVGYILKSTDGGETWRLLDNDYDCDVHTIVVDPTDSERVVIATGGHDARQGKTKGRALYASANGGESWEPVAMNFTQEYSVPLVMSPNDSRVLYSALAHGQPNQWRRETGAESLVIRSQDGGKSWERLEKGLTAAQQQFPEALTIDRENPQRLYAGCRNGDFYATEDGGESWAQLDVKVPGLSSMTLVHA
jgi:photosystem II stability/assembly factor-like uncharacterized protein